MTDIISHRGPDDSGYYCDDHAHLGHCRLSVIDLNNGHQPLTNEDGSLQIVYNGELFNHGDLRQELEKLGHTYRTHCDTETIVHAYEQMGAECLNRFRGMYAFAIWDKGKQRLFCARDRLGKKPFYYFWDGSLFAFASEIKALLSYPSISANAETEVLPEYLAFGYVSEERTLFRGIRKLMPGHYLTLDLNDETANLQVRRYWDVPVSNLKHGMPEAEIVRETRRLLDESVSLRLMSDVPLGVLLSGGVDSSVITAIAQRQSHRRLQTFSVGYDEQPYSELGYAAEVARFLKTEHREVKITAAQFFEALPDLIWHEEEPIAWPSSVSLYFVSRLASRHVKVVLTGEGSDELFGGYERYRWNQINSRAAHIYGALPDGLRRSIRSGLRDGFPLSPDLRRKLLHTFLGREASIESLYLDNFYGAVGPSGEPWLRSDNGSAHCNYLAIFNSNQQSSLLARMLHADQKTYLVELLMKQDQMGMAASIESRVPFLDHEVVEFAATIPDSLKIRGRIQKYVLKKSVEDLLPHRIIHRKKMGFPTPIREWMIRDEARRFYPSLTNRSGFLASILNIENIGRLIDRHVNGLEDNSSAIWRLLNIQLWACIFLGDQPGLALHKAGSTLSGAHKPVENTSPTTSFSAANR
jgi:asparagine synthase (glutamine-hydrolysing)